MFRISDTVERKFVDSLDIDEYEIWTDSGWEDVSAIHKTIEYKEYVLTLENGMSLICADDHIIFRDDMSEVFVKDLKSGDMVMTEDGPIAVKDVVITDNWSNMYDVTVDNPNHRFYSNGILSHNTSVAFAIILHYIIFNKDKKVGVLANKEKAAIEILSRIKLGYEHLPKWIQHGVITWAKTGIELDNGCSVISSATQGSAIRGQSVAFLYIDEHAFIEKYDDFASSVLPTISSGKESRLLITSTPNGLNHFYSIFEKAKRGINGFDWIEVPWQEVPNRDEAWKRNTLENLNFDMDRFRVEYECLVGDTMVTVKDVNGNVTQISMADLYDKLS